VVANYSHILNVKARRFTTGRIPIKILEPISTKGLTKDDVDDLLEKVRSSMLAELKTLTAEARATAQKEAAGLAKASGAQAVAS
jgi:lysophosphatidate acyltransferase